MNNINGPIRIRSAHLIGAGSEPAGRTGKRGPPRGTVLTVRTRFTLRALAVGMILSFGDTALAMPAGGTVTSGSATISSSGGKMVITESTPSVTINWQSFSIGKSEAVQYIQLNGHSVALNRVLGSESSNILGSLSANGRLFLINPNGVVFGSSAQVSVGGLVASTLNITDSDFRAGNYRFSGPGTAAVLNQGSIATNADGGYVALLGANVSNDGIIAARLGTVALAAGNAVTLDVAGDGLLNVTVNQGAVNALVRNGGLIQADGGQVLLTAQAAGNLLQSAVNNTGIVQARSIENRNGVIRLLGGDVVVAGTLDASGSGAGQTGGTVAVTGKTVKLAGATINASGRAGGGRVAVGGNVHGAGPLANARSTAIDGASLINADATITGNGGQIAVWSDGTTTVAGTLSARAGATSGDGGYIETSGKYLTVADGTQVNTSAVHGSAGTWLLDPADFTIGTDILGATLSTNLGLGNVTIHSADGTVVPNGNGDIFVNQAVTWATTTTLTLDAVRDVIMNSTVTPNTGGNYVVIAGRDFTMNNGSTVTPTGGYFTVSAVRDVNLIAGSTVTSTNGNITSTAGQDINLSSDITVTGGNITDNAGRNVNIDVGAHHIADTGGVITFRADNDGTGPGVGGGTVTFTGCINCLTSTVGGGVGSTDIYYNPAAYSALTDYGAGTYVTGTGSGNVYSYAWLFAKGVNKTYDGTDTATLSFKGTPADGGIVTLVAGTATFDTKDVATNKLITIGGYTLGGADALKFSLFNGTGTTTAEVTQAPLAITAGDVAKSYGQTPALTAFTPVGLQNGETIGAVTETSPGAAATASVAGSPYAITATGASGGSFSAANYAITFFDGALTVSGSLTPPVTSGDRVQGEIAAGLTSGPLGKTGAVEQANSPGVEMAEMLFLESVTQMVPELSDTLLIAPGPTRLITAIAKAAPNSETTGDRPRKQDRN